MSTTEAPKRRSIYDDMAVTVPEGAHGSVTVERFEVEKDSLSNLRLSFEGRGCIPGTYTRLLRNGRLWMSDTTAERRDHFEPARKIAQFTGFDGRVLIGGLGLGMILQVAINYFDRVEHVDVVEIDPDVIALVGPHYEAMAAERGVSLEIHQADVFEKRWAPGTRWDIAWFDVWGDISTDDLEPMSKLRRSYGRRAGWCGCWGQEQMRYRREQERRQGWWR